DDPAPRARRRLAARAVRLLPLPRAEDRDDPRHARASHARGVCGRVDLRAQAVTNVYADVYRYRELLGNLFRRDLQAKYRGSALGVLWTVANPIMLMGVYLLVFGVVWPSPFAQGGHYPLFLLSGLALWTFFAAAVQSATRSMLDNANLIRKTRFPRQLVPLSVVFAPLL